MKILGLVCLRRRLGSYRDRNHHTWKFGCTRITVNTCICSVS